MDIILSECCSTRALDSVTASWRPWAALNLICTAGMGTLSADQAAALPLSLTLLLYLSPSHALLNVLPAVKSLQLAAATASAAAPSPASVPVPPPAPLPAPALVPAPAVTLATLLAGGFSAGLVAFSSCCFSPVSLFVVFPSFFCATCSLKAKTARLSCFSRN